MPGEMCNLPGLRDVCVCVWVCARAHARTRVCVPTDRGHGKYCVCDSVFGSKPHIESNHFSDCPTYTRTRMHARALDSQYSTYTHTHMPVCQAVRVLT